MKVSIDDLYKVIPEELESDVADLDIEDYKDEITEMDVIKALEFFDIYYDEGSQTIDIPEAFEVHEAKAVIKAYLTIVNNQEFKDIGRNILERAITYNDYTAQFREGDDGTFDYCGKYMLDTFYFVEQYLEKSQN